MPATLSGLCSYTVHSLALGLVLAGLVASSGCKQDAPKSATAKPVEVVVASAVMKDVINFEDFTGTLEAFKKIDVTSRVTGYLEKVNFVEGGSVKAGQVLFEIDPRTAKAELDKAEAEVVQSQARATRLRGDMQRAEELVRSRSIAKEEFEKVLGDFEEAKAAVGVAAAKRKSAQLNYEYTKVLSPIDGRAGRSLLDEGNLIKADMTVLTTVVTQEPIYAYFDVDERTLLTLRRRVNVPSKSAQPVRVAMALADEEGFPHFGEINFEDNAVDQATGTQRLRGVFDNKNGLFAPGMFVRIRLQVGEMHPSVIVPEEGVGTDQGQKFVYLVNSKNEVEYRKIKTGSLEKGWRVVDEGLAAGDRIVVSGLQRVRPMMKVEPREEKTQPALAARETPVNVR